MNRSAQETSDPQPVLERLQAAQNRHDLDTFVACFAADYRSEQPAHPSWRFRGREQVRQNWSEVFRGIPDFQADLLRSVAAGDTLWAEWHWHGTRTGGAPFEMRGVTIFGVEDGLIAWGRLYVEPVEQAGAGIEAAVQRMAEGPGT